MSAQPLPPLSQPPTDFESDSDYLGTPVDPPSATQPHVAGYGPLGDADYYYTPASYANSEYAHHPLSAPSQYRYSDPGPAGTEQSVLLGPCYVQPTSDDCTRPDSSMPAYRWSGSGQNAPNPHPEQITPPAPTGITATPRADSNPPSLIRSSRADDHLHPHYPGSLHYPDLDGDQSGYGEDLQHTPPFPIAKSRNLGLVCNTSVGDQSPASQRSLSSPANVIVPPAASFPHSYFDEGYIDSPTTDLAACDPFGNLGCARGQYASYDGQSQQRPSALDAHMSTAAHAQPRHSVQFYQPPSCPYSYPRVGDPIDAPEYSSDLLAMPALYHGSVIHAPRPHQYHDVHSLHDHRGGDPHGLDSAPHVLSIPSGPMPPVPRPSSLIEDSPKKPLTLACFFCRKRKIACQSPPANSLDRTCNQCAKRKLNCVYPATSRRGVRPRVYDVGHDVRLSRASAAQLSL